MALAATTLALQAAAQGAPTQPPATRADCVDLLVVGGESYDFAAGGSGRGFSIDGMRCLEPSWSAHAGAATFDVADSRWTFGRLGATLRMPAGYVAHFIATGGSGRNAAGPFAYRKLSGGISIRARDTLYAKVEHEYIDVDVNRGNLARLGVVAVVASGISVDVTVVRSLGGNLGTRAAVARIDAVTGAVRLFGGHAHGRLPPQVVDVASGERAPDVVSRGTFAGLGVKLPLGELIAAVDTTRTGQARRNTYALAWQVPLP